MDTKSTDLTRLAYIDCTAGISGDMTLGALIDAGVPIEVLNRAIGSLGLPDVKIEVEQTIRCGIRAKKAEVRFEPEKTHRHLSEILDRIHSGEHLTDRAKQIASSIFQRLGHTEAKVHGVPVEKVHFHEVGAADSIADIVGAAVGFRLPGSRADRRLAGRRRVGHDPDRSRHVSRPRPGHRRTALRHPDRSLARCGRTDDPDRSGDSCGTCQPVWPDAADDRRADRLRSGQSRFREPRQRRPTPRRSVGSRHRRKRRTPPSTARSKRFGRSKPISTTRRARRSATASSAAGRPARWTFSPQRSR